MPAEIAIARKDDEFSIQLAVKLVDEALRTKSDIDQVLLTIAAERGQNEYVRFYAADKLTDEALAQKVFADIAFHSTYEYDDLFCFRLISADELTDKDLAQKAYVDIALDSEVFIPYRFRAINSLTDKSLTQNAYAYIAMDKSIWESDRLESAEQITDETLAQKAYFDIAMDERVDIFDRMNSAKKLTDKDLEMTVYANIAYNEKNNGYELEAKAKLGFEYSMYTVCELDGDPYVRHISDKIKAFVTIEENEVKAINNQGVLTNIAIYYQDGAIRKAAVHKLTDQDTLAGIAFDDKKEDVRVAAVDKLVDQDVLAEIAQWDDSEIVREAAIDQLTDQDLLYEIAKNNESAITRSNACLKAYGRHDFGDDCICAICGEEIHDFRHDPDYNPDNYEFEPPFVPEYEGTCRRCRSVKIAYQLPGELITVYTAVVKPKGN